jgi:hypothetical protein
MRRTSLLRLMASYHERVCARPYRVAAAPLALNAGEVR